MLELAKAQCMCTVLYKFCGVAIIYEKPKSDLLITCVPTPVIDAHVCINPRLSNSIHEKIINNLQYLFSEGIFL